MGVPAIPFYRTGIYRHCTQIKFLASWRRFRSLLVLYFRVVLTTYLVGWTISGSRKARLGGMVVDWLMVKLIYIICKASGGSHGPPAVGLFQRCKGDTIGSSTDIVITG